MTTSAYRLDSNNYNIDNVIDFDSYHRAREMTTRRFVLSPVAPAEPTVRTTRQALPRRNHHSYVNRMAFDTALYLCVIAATFAFTFKMIAII